MRVEDGKGSGIFAKVTNDNRVCTSSVISQQGDNAACLGDKYNLNTGDITLTDAAATTVFYLKNNEDKDLIITSLIYNLGTSTGGSGDGKIDVLRNPTAGDIVTNANNVAINSNQDFGSSKTLTADVFVGATSEAVVTDGTVSISTRLNSATGRTVLSLGSVVIPKGSSLAINYTPPTSNTSQICQFAAACFLLTPG